jgi:hypothetical protein
MQPEGVGFPIQILQVEGHLLEEAGVFVGRAGEGEAAAKFGPVATHDGFVSRRIAELAEMLKQSCVCDEVQDGLRDEELKPVERCW